MIDIHLNAIDSVLSGYVKARGSNETITNEIYAILKSLSEQCPVPFEDAIERHSQELIEKLIDKEVGE